MMNIRKSVLVLASLGLLGLCGAVSGADAVGYVRVVRGDAYLVAGGQETRAVPDAPVQSGSRIRTGAGAALGIVFKDNTVISVGPATDLSVDDYAYSPRDGLFKLDATLGKGTLAYLAGAIGRQNPAGVNLKTPTGTVGVRGSHFAVKVD